MVYAIHINCWGLRGRQEHLATALIALPIKKKKPNSNACTVQFVSLYLFTSREPSLNSSSKNHVALHIRPPPKKSLRHRVAELLQWKWHKSETKNKRLSWFTFVPTTQMEHEHEGKIKYGGEKKRQGEKPKRNHLRCFSDDGQMMKEQPWSEPRANTERLQSLWKISREAVCVCVVCVCFDLLTAQRSYWCRWG